MGDGRGGQGRGVPLDRALTPKSETLLEALGHPINKCWGVAKGRLFQGLCVCCSFFWGRE